MSPSLHSVRERPNASRNNDVRRFVIIYNSVRKHGFTPDNLGLTGFYAGRDCLERMRGRGRCHYPSPLPPGQLYCKRTEAAGCALELHFLNLREPSVSKGACQPRGIPRNGLADWFPDTERNRTGFPLVDSQPPFLTSLIASVAESAITTI